MKSKITSIFTALFLSTAFASQIILIDFGSAAGAGGTGWNTLNNATATLTTTFELDDTSGIDSGLTIGPFTAASVNGANRNLNVGTTGGPSNLESAHIPIWANADAINDYFVLANSTGNTELTGGFVISGLQAGWTYNVNLAIFGADGADRNASYTFSVYDSVEESYRSVLESGVINTRYRPSENLFGHDLSFSFVAGANETSLRVLATTGDRTADQAPFNAMQIVAIPEPSTIALSLLAFGAVLMFRRRK
jgi:hypothetical protein